MDGLPYCNLHRKKDRNKYYFMFLASTVVVQRGSRAEFGSMSKLLKVKTTNDRFFVLSTVYQKYLFPLLTTLSLFQNGKIC